jgi:hypothetical protein
MLVPWFGAFLFLRLTWETMNSLILRLETSVVSQKLIEEQPQILRLTTPRLKSTPGAPFAQDDSSFCAAYF